MTRNLKDVYPPVEELLELEPEEIAVFLLDHLCELENSKILTGLLNRYNYTLDGNIHAYAGDKTREVAKILTEAWIWLEKEGMIAPRPGDSSGSDWIFVTRRGHRLGEKGNLEAYRKGHFLPRENLDESLLRKVYPTFIRGDYDTAVFQAYKEVEVRVRKKAGLSNDLYGVDLMRKAFHPDKGALTDKTALSAERQAMSDLFAGSIGIFKNPSSHRDVDFENPTEVAGIIVQANNLLHLIDRL